MKLNMSTRQWHAAVDEPWLQLLRPTVSRAAYLTQLLRVYGLVAPFESACKYTPHVVARLPEVNHACSYLAAFDRVDDHWTTVARLLDRIGAAPDAANDMLAAASSGFATVKQWLHAG